MIRKPIVKTLTVAALVCAVGMLASVLVTISYIGATTSLVIAGGCVGVVRGTPPSDLPGWNISQPAGPMFYMPRFEKIGFMKIAVVPLWMPFLTLVAYPVVALVRGQSHPPGGCARCGYDLTGNVTGVCPECGSSLDAKRPA